MITELTFVPIGCGEENKELIAQTTRIIAESDRPYLLTATGILIDAEWDEVMQLAKKCRDALLRECPRIIIDIHIDDRSDPVNSLKQQTIEVEYALGRSLETGGLT